jgi:GT2 family glycosyltransferase
MSGGALGLIGELFRRPRYFYANALQVLQQQGGRALLAMVADKYRSFREKNTSKAYQEWINAYDTLSAADKAAIRAHIATFRHSPRISVLMPVYNTPEQWLRRAIESVRCQLYPHWELCIADDASPAPHVRPLIEEYRQLDPRIRVVFREQNGHISAASNSALELATGEFAALLDHDDELAEHALYLVAELLNRHQGADIIYSDEDKIDEAGRRFEPFCKPAWNPDLFLAQNYLSHLGVYRTDLLRRVGGFRQGFEGSQDYDLAIRCVAATKAEHIRHIPFILYHWRAIAGSTALSTAQKGYAEDAAVRALGEHFRAVNPAITVEPGGWPTTYRARYPLPDPPPRVTIMIPTRDGLSLLRRCVTSIREKTAYPDYELLIVDNRSTDPATLSYLEGLAASGAARVLPYDGEFNFSAINNFAARQATGGILCLLNNDMAVITPEWLMEMVTQALRPEIGAVGAKLAYPDDRIQHAGIILGLMGVANHSHQFRSRHLPGYFAQLKVPRSVAAVTGACLVVRRELFDLVGGLDETHLPVAFNDVDFCLRLNEAGYRTLWTPYAELYHHESASRGSDQAGERRARLAAETAYMQKRWGARLMNDPYYSPNLSLERNDFSLARPPRVVKPWVEKG